MQEQNTEIKSGENEVKEKILHRLFDVGVILKGVNAAIEIIGGGLAIFISKNFVTDIVLKLTQNELSEDPKDFISNYLISAAHNFSVSAQDFLIFYLLSHGIIKLILVIALLKNKMWAYPASLVVLGLFVVYQVYRYSYSHSVWLIPLTIFDLIVLWLIYHEYRTLENRAPKLS